MQDRGQGLQHRQTTGPVRGHAAARVLEVFGFEMCFVPAGSQKTTLMVQDVRKAYFYAPAIRDVYVELPPEQAQPGMCAKLHKSLYGTRDAALNWSQAYSEVFEGMGFVKGRSSPCSFYHELWIRLVVHGRFSVGRAR